MKIDNEARYFPIKELVAKKQEQGETITVVIPALNEEETIGEELTILSEKLMKEHPLIDQIVVMDGNSTDKTVEIASQYTADVISLRNSIGADFPSGKGTAMWSSLKEVTSSIVIFVDADIENFDTHFVTALVKPFLCDEALFTKAFYNRPIHQNGTVLHSGGGRVTELLVRPLFSRFFPKASDFIQPLAGEYGFRTEVLKQLQFYSDYGVETSLNLDFIKKFGTEKLVQVDLGERIHRNRPLEDLSKMSAIILQTFVDFAEEENILNSEQRGSDQFKWVKDGSISELTLKQKKLPIYNEVF